MLKASVLANLVERTFSNGVWLCTLKGKQVIKQGACESLYTTEFVGPHRYGKWARTVEVYKING